MTNREALIEAMARAIVTAAIRQFGKERDFKIEAEAALAVVCKMLREPSEEMFETISEGLGVSSGGTYWGREAAILRALADHLEGKEGT